jgi:AP-2 complex subunit alpha
MNPNPNPSYNIIKGLQIFINDIRGCTTKEAENKRVEKELNKIREKFATGKALTGYEKKKCVWKLLYIYILGYRVDFGHNYCADLITSIKFSEKMTGYISMSVLFKDNNPEINIMVNCIRNDLLNTNALCQSMALALATNLNNNELLETIAPDVFKFITTFSERQLFTVKKALICLTKVIKVKKEFHDTSTWTKAIMRMLDLKYIEILLACGGLVLNIIQQYGSSGYEDLAMKFFNNVLYKMKECPDDYVYYHIKAPWLQIKILKILQMFNPSIFDTATINHIKEYVDYIGKKTHTIASSESKYTRYYAEYCIFFEVVNLIDHMNLKLHHKTFDSYIGILGLFLQEDQRKHPNKDVNTKYLALDGMAKLSKYTSGSKILKEHSNIIIYSLRDNDISIRRRALDLLFLSCTGDSVQMICKELLIYFKEDEPQLKEDVALKIAILAEKYAADFTWYVDVCIKMLELAGDYVSDDILYRIVQIVTGFENQESNTSLQIYACEKIIKLLEKDYVFESVVRLSSYLLGEFGYLLEKASSLQTNNGKKILKILIFKKIIY